ncbi:MAG: Hsp20/alpha crystallin family protein [Polyangiaceae bacterium]|nr:Hsp20/alpha crystallin family protein [Polyangiaceae bacterium]
MLNPFFDLTDHFRWIGALERQMDRAFVSGGRDESRSWFVMRDAGDALILRADLPGFTEKDLEITLENDVLTLRAEGHKRAFEGYKTVRTERAKLGFSRQIELPVRVDSDGVVATLKDGVLELKLPKAVEARQRRIPIIGAKNETVS